MPGRSCGGGCRRREGRTGPPPYLPPLSSRRPLRRTGLTLTLAGLAFTSIISPGLNGLGFLPALVAGFLTSLNLTRLGMANRPGPFLPSCCGSTPPGPRTRRRPAWAPGRPWPPAPCKPRTSASAGGFGLRRRLGGLGGVSSWPSHPRETGKQERLRRGEKVEGRPRIVEHISRGTSFGVRGCMPALQTHAATPSPCLAARRYSPWLTWRRRRPLRRQVVLQPVDGVRLGVGAGRRPLRPPPLRGG